MNRVFALVATAAFANAVDLTTQTSASAKNDDPCAEDLAYAKATDHWDYHD